MRDDRSVCLDILWAHALKFGYIDRESFGRHCDGWGIIPLAVDEEIAGAVLCRNNEVHVVVRDWARGRWLNKRALRILRDMLAEHGSVVTSINETNALSRKFAERLGFCRTGNNDGYVGYELRRMNH